MLVINIPCFGSFDLSLFVRFLQLDLILGGFISGGDIVLSANVASSLYSASVRT